MYYVLGGLSIICVLYSIFFIICRLLNKSGHKIKILKEINDKKSFFPTKKECFKVFGIILSSRVLLIILSVIVYLLFMKSDSPSSISDAINNWIKWDAMHYLRIAHGYSYYIENGNYVTLVFFPLYPFFIKILSIVLNDVISGLIISNVSFSIACVYIYKLLCMDYDKKTAKISLVLISIFPYSFFFSGIMSESVFLLFSAMSLYYIRKHKWYLAGICGLLCALTRSLGVFIIIPAVVELIEEYQLFKKVKIKYLVNIFVNKFLFLLLIPLGFGIYLYFNYQTTGDWFYFLKMQSEIWYQNYTHFFLIFKTLFGMVSGYGSNIVLYIAIPEIIIIIISYLVLVLNVRNRITMYSVWLLVNIIVNTSISWPLSICRYLTCAIPLYIFIANYLKIHRNMYIIYIIINVVLHCLLFYAFFINSYIY